MALLKVVFYLFFSFKLIVENPCIYVQPKFTIEKVRRKNSMCYKEWKNIVLPETVIIFALIGIYLSFKKRKRKKEKI